MNLALNLQITGGLLLLLAALNVFVIPRHFGWHAELQRVSLLTRQVFFVHAMFIVLVLVLTGLLSLVWSEHLLAPSRLAKLVSGGLAIFWGARLATQWFVYDRRLWLGQRFRTAAHFAFSGLWLYFTIVYGAAAWSQ